MSLSGSQDEALIAYPCQNNVVIRNAKNLNDSYVFTDFQSKVTAVKFAPNSKVVAAGDDKGRVKIFEYNADSKEVFVKKEHNMIPGAVQTISWTDDSVRIFAAGEGKDSFAKAVIAESGSKLGDIFGPTRPVISSDLKQKPYRLVMGGEDYQIYVFDGVPFKHVKTIQAHSNFVNKIAFREDGK